jgi:hypothetical protein
MPPLIGVTVAVAAVVEDVVDMMLGVRAGGLGNCKVGVGEVGVAVMYTPESEDSDM